jgi:hypothetical protein
MSKETAIACCGKYKKHTNTSCVGGGDAKLLNVTAVYKYFATGLKMAEGGCRLTCGSPTKPHEITALSSMYDAVICSAPGPRAQRILIYTKDNINKC